MAETPVWRMAHAVASGATFWHGTPQDRVLDDTGPVAGALWDEDEWDDGLWSGDSPVWLGPVAIEHEFVGSPDWEGLPRGQASLELAFDRLDLVVREAAARYRIAHRTPYGEADELEVQLPVSIWDEAEWDAGEWTGPGAPTWQDAHVSVGLAAQGRSLVPVLRHAQRGEGFGVSVAEVIAYPVAPYLRAR